MTPMYYRGASAAILVYDVTSVESFECVKDWVTGVDLLDDVLASFVCSLSLSILCNHGLV